MKNNKNQLEQNKKLQKLYYKEQNEKIDIILKQFFNNPTTITI
jgi:hypothetical protein